MIICKERNDLKEQTRNTRNKTHSRAPTPVSSLYSDYKMIICKERNDLKEQTRNTRNKTQSRTPTPFIT